LFSGLGFFLLLPWMQRTLTISLDVDWLWRRGLPLLARSAARFGSPLVSAVQTRIVSAGSALTTSARNTMGHSGPLGRSWEIGTTALWIVLLLMVYVFAYYLF
jgi:multicomponent Na+:H+ antiporter subunit D